MNRVTFSRSVSRLITSSGNSSNRSRCSARVLVCHFPWNCHHGKDISRMIHALVLLASNCKTRLNGNAYVQYWIYRMCDSSSMEIVWEIRNNKTLIVPCTGPCSNLFGGLTERSLSEQARLMPPPSSSLSITFDEIRPPLLPAVDNAHNTCTNCYRMHNALLIFYYFKCSNDYTWLHITDIYNIYIFFSRIKIKHTTWHDKEKRDEKGIIENIEKSMRLHSRVPNEKLYKY